MRRGRGKVKRGEGGRRRGEGRSEEGERFGVRLKGGRSEEVTRGDVVATMGR